MELSGYELVKFYELKVGFQSGDKGHRGSGLVQHGIWRWRVRNDMSRSRYESISMRFAHHMPSLTESAGEVISMKNPAL